MNLQGIVSLSGKGGLFKVIGQNKSGFILEALDASKARLVTHATSKLATLSDITVYGEQDELQLKDIFKKMQEQSVAVPEAKSEPAMLKEYFKKVAPEHDAERVYASDIKKIVSWYKMLSVLPLWNEPDKAEEAPETAEEQS